MVQDALAFYLEHLTSCAVECVCSGQECMQSVLEKEFDLILCNLQSPGVDGQFLYAELAHLRPDQAERVAFLAGDATCDTCDAFLANTHLPILTKPLFSTELRTLVERLAERSGPA